MNNDVIAYEYYETLTGRRWLDDLGTPERERLEGNWRATHEEAGAFWQRMWSNLDRQ